MNITINQQAVQLPDPANVAEIQRLDAAFGLHYLKRIDAGGCIAGLAFRGQPCGSCA